MDKLPNIKTPEKIQDFLNTLEFNFEKKSETWMSPSESIKAGRAHCFEGALLAAALFWQNGEKPLILDLKTTKDDFEHVVALFKRDGYWGAISKTNHAVLRYREPVYKTVRELVMSYFHEYFLSSGKKTLRSYSKPFDLSKFGKTWITSQEDLYHIDRALDLSPHIKILTQKQIKNLRNADKVEIKAGEIIEYPAV